MVMDLEICLSYVAIFTVKEYSLFLAWNQSQLQIPPNKWWHNLNRYKSSNFYIRSVDHELCDAKKFMLRDDEFPEELSHSEEHLKLRDDLEKLRLRAEIFCDNDTAVLGCEPDHIIRKVAHGTFSWLYCKYWFKWYPMVNRKCWSLVDYCLNDSLKPWTELESPVE